MSTYDDDELDNDNKEREESRRENFEEYYEQPLQVRLENARDDDEDDYYDDEPRFKLTPQMIAVIAAVAIVVIVIICFIVAAVKNKNKKGGETNEPETPAVVEQTLPTDYEGFSVLAQIKIEKIGCEQYILDSTDDKALEVGVGKLYGGVLNGIGNVSIVGHNTEGKFGKLGELTKGDTFIIVDKNNKETTYKITDIETVEPDNLEVLLPGEGKAEMTLITCENGSTKRLIVKAIKTATSSSTNTSTTSGTSTTSKDGQ